jgi:zinc transport system substrate-binding protein
MKMLFRLKRTVILLSLAVLLLISLAACSGKTAEAESGKIKVIVSFDAMREFAAAVGGDKVEISVIVPDGTEPHDFEPKAQDIASLSKAAVFVMNGLGMESWAEDTVEAAGNSALVVVDASEGAELITSGDKTDPHLLLSIKGAITEVNNIKDGFIKADPGNKEYYEANCSDYTAKLEKMYNDFTEKLASVKKKNFVTGHAAFAYLCRDFGLNQNSVEDVFAEGEPSAQQLAELAGYCRDNAVTTIFAEEMASPEVSRALADEVGAVVETILYNRERRGRNELFGAHGEHLEKIYKSLS